MFRGEKTLLRSYEKADIAKAHQLFNDFEVQKYLNSGIIMPFSLQDEEKHIESLNRERGYFFAIDTLEGVYIGGCGGFEHDEKSDTIVVGIAIANKEYWGGGYGTDAMKVLLKFLFQEVNVRKVLLKVFSYNERGIRCYRKLGFVEEGRLKEQYYRDGGYFDEIIMSLFRKEYKFLE